VKWRHSIIIRLAGKYKLEEGGERKKGIEEKQLKNEKKSLGLNARMRQTKSRVASYRIFKIQTSVSASFSKI
jgi:hypothetical protein